MIGLAGAHRTGKTTLAQDFAPKMGFDGNQLMFVKSNLSGVLRSHGCNARNEYDFRQRLMLQNAMLDALEAQYREAPKWFITDRTPICVAAYTLAEIGRSTVQESSFEKEVEDHIDRAFEITNTYFAMLALIQPGIPVVDAPGKAPPSLAYINHLNFILRGLMISPKLEVARYLMPTDCLDIAERIASLGELATNIINSTSESAPTSAKPH